MRTNTQRVKACNSCYMVLSFLISSVRYANSITKKLLTGAGKRHVCFNRMPLFLDVK